MSDEAKRDSVERVFHELCDGLGLKRVQSITLTYNWQECVGRYEAICLILDSELLEPIRAVIKRGELRGRDDE